MGLNLMERLMTKRTRLHNLIVAISFLIMAFLWGCGAKNPTSQPVDAIVQTPVMTSFAVMAEGKVVPVRNAILSFPVPGVVAEIVKDEGSQLKKGEIIAWLNGKENAEASIAAAEAQLTAAQQALDKLIENAALEKASKELALAEAQKALEDANKERERRDYIRVNQNTLDGIKAQFILAQDAVDKAEKDFSYFEDREEDDPQRAYFLTILVNARKARDIAKYNLEYASNYYDPEEIAEANAKVSVAQANLAKTQKDYDSVKNGPDPDDLELAEAAVQNARAQLTAAHSAHDNLALKAPFDGKVVSNDLEVGEYVTPGSQLVAFGDLSGWQVETTDLTELNVIDIQVGDPVAVTVDAVPGLSMEGEVIGIKSYGENRQGDITYTVYVKLLAPDDRLKWNMTAFVVFE